MMETGWPQVLQEQGFRLTRPRLQVLEAIAEHGELFAAEEVEAWVPAVGRATVYRALKLLVELGLLCKVLLDDGSPRYSLSAAGHHHHLVCVSCGTVREFHQSVIEQVLRQLGEPKVGTVVGHRIEVFILCPNCQSTHRDGC